MAKNVDHRRIFLHSLRTSLIFLAGFLAYDLLKMFETEWNKNYPDNKLRHISHRKSYHFIIIFLFDFFIIYSIALLLDIHF